MFSHDGGIMKRSMLVALSLVSFATSQVYATEVAKNTRQITRGSDEKTAPKHFFFDLHGVLITKSAWTMLTKGVGNLLGTKETFKGKLFLLSQFWQILFDVKFYRQLKALLHERDPQGRSLGKNKTTESYFNAIRNIGYEDIYVELTQFANNIFVLNKNLLPVLQELKDNGHHLHLLSNIGTSILQDIKERNLFPELFGKDGIFEDQKNSINQEVPANGFYGLSKPQGSAYKKALEYVGASEANSIMIDDKEKNLPTEKGIALAQKKATKSKIYLEPATPWLAGVVYTKKSHAAAAKELRELGRSIN